MGILMGKPACDLERSPANIRGGVGGRGMEVADFRDLSVNLENDIRREKGC